MTILRFGPLLAIAGAACLVAWTPHGRPPPPEVVGLGLASRLGLDAPPTETASVTGVAQSASAGPFPPKAALSDADLASQFAYADVPELAPGRAVGLTPPPTVGAEPASVPALPSAGCPERRGLQGPIRLRQP